MRPPWASTIRLQVARPIPLPSCSPPARVNISKIALSLGQSDPVVAYREGPAGLAVFRGHRDVRYVAVVKLEGVGDQVLKDPDHPRAACLHRGKRADLDVPVDAFDLRRQRGEDLGHDLAAVNLGAARAVVAR